MEETGPSLWREIHCHRAADGSFIQRIDQQIPCGDCRRHWQALLQQRPPEFSEGWFAWTVWLHNEINARLNKPLMTVEEAQAIWA